MGGELGFGGGQFRKFWSVDGIPPHPPPPHTHTKENPDPPGCLPSQGKFREFFFLEKSGKSQEN